MPAPKRRSPSAGRRDTPRLVAPEEMRELVRAALDALAWRAFEFYEAKGRPDGRDLEDWLRAESELMHPARLEISQTRKGLTLRAEVHGFRAPELTVCVEPRRVTITGERRRTGKRTRAETVYSERRGERILRVVGLPTDVDPTRAAATLAEGVLELSLPLGPRSQ